LGWRGKPARVLPAGVVVADTACDVDPLRQAIAAKGALAVIPNGGFFPLPKKKASARGGFAISAVCREPDRHLRAKMYARTILNFPICWRVFVSVREC
jgi:hypothetical protein